MARARNKVEKKTEAETTAADLDAIEAALNGDGDLDIELEISDEIDESELAAAVEADEAKEAAYEAQSSDEEKAPEEKTAKKGKTRSVGSTATPDEFADTLVKLFGTNPAVFDTDEGELDEAGLRKVAASVTQKKVREKVVNFLKSVTMGGEPTNYTKIANKIMVDAYLDNCRPVTLAEIKDAYVAAGYKPGTVNAQAGQMMAMYPALSMAKRTEVRGQITPNANSVLLDIIASS